MAIETFESVWDAIEGDPADRERMKMRSALMTAIGNRIDELGLTPGQAAERLGVSQPRISALKTGQITRFSIDSLLRLADGLGLKTDLRVYAAPVYNQTGEARIETVDDASPPGREG